ncbi:hypothetical protein CDD82_2790 [Ophiocordyceps australis]|uniref:MARVEL domain-containing protein n=1 Tax=Ophiocordyceps australis TaxID=1399860 RepID=A0A2C5ZGH6_9HYPO|nr:hypothetical protein CDD82_2790 [Ophiocordyceps australis]
MPKNTGIGLAGIVLLGTSLLLLWFVILSGVTRHTPLNHTYFLRADTSGITGARDTTQWTYFYHCGLNNQDCHPARAAPAFGRAWDSNADNIPNGLGGSHGKHTTSFRIYYMWRFGWVFLMMTLFFEVLSFFSAFLACCGRLGAAVSYFISSIALFFYALGVSLTTAVFVIARNKFHKAGRSSKIGPWAFGFLWGSFVALLIADILFCFGIRGASSRNKSSTGGSTTGGGGGGGIFSRNRSTRSRSYDGRRVKEEYS